MNFAKLDHILNAAVPSTAPAIVCRVEQAGQVVFERGYGWLNPMLKSQPVSASTVFDLASLTKLFTTVACLRLHDRGELDIDEPVAHYLPSFAGHRAIGPAEDPVTKEPAAPLPDWSSYTNYVDAGSVTFRHLLTHTSGLPAWRSVYRECGPPPTRTNSLHKAELLRRQRAGLAAICCYPFSYPPGQTHIYSDIGLIVLGAAIARCRGDQTVADSIRELVTNPLGLTALFTPSCVVVDRVAPTEYCQWRKRRLHGEVHDENAAGLGAIAGHAGLFATAADVCRLGNLFLAGGEHLLSARIVEDSISPQIEIEAPGMPLHIGETHYRQTPTAVVGGIRRGLGWMLNSGIGSSCGTAFGPRSFGHTGFTGTSLWCDPDRELAVTLLTNRVYHGRAPEQIDFLRPQVHAAVIDGLDAV